MSGRLWGSVLAGIELVLLSALIVVPRCANHQEVFVAGNVYFTDADCYARMSRVRLCLAHPGLVLRHHDFENFPKGITPHTTAPLDYLILVLAVVLTPWTAHALDLAGAFISPLLALLGGCYLWWWACRMKFRHRWPMLVVYAFSPILVHGTEMGRPDHQSLLMVLLAVALCAEWSWLATSSRGWGITAGCAWGFALWVSLYEPLILLGIVLIASFFQRGSKRWQMFGPTRKAGWLCFTFALALALLIERRLPSFANLVTDPFVRQWTRTIGELQHVPLFSDTWFGWTGWLIVAVPLLVWWQRRHLFAAATPHPLVMLMASLGGTFLLTMGQARWGYFFVSVFAITLPVLLDSWRSCAWVAMAFALSLWPMAREWDERLWPNQAELTERAADRLEKVGLRELAAAMVSPETRPFLAPWWLSPSLAYWSQQPAVAGSSHEGMDGIVASARFYAATDMGEARKILEDGQVRFVFGYEGDRVAENCSQILGHPVGRSALCYVLDGSSVGSEDFLVPVGQNRAGKLFQIANNR